MGETIGHLQFDWYGIPKGTPVKVALGDLHCSVYANHKEVTDAGRYCQRYSKVVVVKVEKS